jgi:hypothetical protein
MRRSLVPSVGATMLRLTLLKAALHLLGFARTWRWMSVRAEAIPPMTDVNADLVARAEYAIATGAALYPGRAACLERSLVLYWWLRRAGVPVEYRMGVQMYPFLAHAWVEFRGQVVNDVPEHVKLFRPFGRVPA